MKKTLRSLGTTDLHAVRGGIWRYTSRLGAAGEQLEANQDGKYGDLFNPSNLDEAADQVNQGWVTIP